MTFYTAVEEAQVRAALAHLRGGSASEVPVAAVVFDAAGEVIGVGTNTRATTGDYAGHAEIVALNAAALARQDRVLSDCTLAVTLEPCVMCAGAILASRVGKVVFGAWDDKAGAAGSVYDVLRDGYLPHPVPEVTGGVCAAECAAELQRFFAAKR
ncbi:nucleoside deaminase [Leucobacter sp. OH2974_COT-288]|nr:nucleoside deaminase [Leucobacter sp. OH2974_COT-288]